MRQHEAEGAVSGVWVGYLYGQVTAGLGEQQRAFGYILVKRQG